MKSPRAAFLLTLIIMAINGTAHASLSEANQALKDGNYADAYDLYLALVDDTELDPSEASGAVRDGTNCLLRLGRFQELDGYLEKWTTNWANSWEVLLAVARARMQLPKRGHIVDGEFQRDHWGPRDASNRDRVVALQLMLQARPMVPEDEPRQKEEFYDAWGDIIKAGRDGSTSWKLQHLTDLTTLPSFEESRWDESRRAPVDAEGNPVLYDIPASWEEAENDGERWRWTLEQFASTGDGPKARAKMEYARFLNGQFGVGTLSYIWGNQEDAQTVQKLARKLRDLSDEETMAYLASGPKQFTLPAEHNPLLIYQSLIEDESTPINQAQVAINELARNYIARDQRVQAASYLDLGLTEFLPDGDDSNWEKNWTDLRDQIVNAIGRFDGTRSEPAGEAVKVGFIFRNATEVNLQARRINFELLLSDLKAYLREEPKDLDYKVMNLGNLGARLLEADQQKYLEEEVASWTAALDPRENHLDARTEIETPLQDAGAYWLEAHLIDGNKTSVIVWISDTAIVRKNLRDGAHYFIADAMDGEPVQGAEVEFFGYDLVDGGPFSKGKRKVTTITRVRQSNFQGETTFEDHEDLRWLITATTSTGRFAYLGFNQIWNRHVNDDPFNRIQMFTITDRPVYRPGHEVKFKIWMGRSTYEQMAPNEFAGEQLSITIEDPSGEEIHQSIYQADGYGGVTGSITLEDEAKLGQYSIRIENEHRNGYGFFRVEEYKKPEFEVIVDAPEEPISLGDTFQAKVSAKYYFGAPVTNGEAKVKVTRTKHTERFFPIMPWDWLYGNGYAFDLPEHPWYRGWSEWGCFAPYPRWGGWSPPQEELVLEETYPLGPNGNVEVELDTALALELHGDSDHKYDISVEVTDASRRTIYGSGSVIAARKPFEVFVALNRGFYEAGDAIEVRADVNTPDGKPVSGEGKFILYQITYDEDGEPVETEVFSEEATADEDGVLKARFNAAEAGQFRVACEVTSDGETQEGGRLIVVRGDREANESFRFNDLELIPDKPTYAPGETMQLMINTARPDSTVVLFSRPVDGVYEKPQIISIDGKSGVREVTVEGADQPNFFVEAYVVSSGEVYEVVKEIAVPPVERKLEMEVISSSDDYRPSETAKVTVKLTEENGTPYQGQTVLAVYDKALEYISGGSNIDGILPHFWSWKRDHYPSREDSLGRFFGNRPLSQDDRMRNLGLGIWTPDMERATRSSGLGFDDSAAADPFAAMEAAPMVEEAGGAPQQLAKAAAPGAPPEPDAQQQAPMVEAVVRTNFADSIYWAGALETDAEGVAEVEFPLPDNLTTWKVKGWAMGDGTRVGEDSAEFTTSKKLVLRQQAPRFFVEKDEVVLSANVHNYLDEAKMVEVSLELDGDSLGALNEDDLVKTFELGAGEEERIDWTVAALTEGEATIRMKALTDIESDAMEVSYPVMVHGILKTEAWSGALRPEEESSEITFRVPDDRKPEESKLEIRYSPSVAAAMVDALPYLIDYPHGCTEQTVNRFIPAVITRRVLDDAGISLLEVRRKAVNLNPQQLGEAQERAQQWKDHILDQPIYNERKLDRLIAKGVEKLVDMQNDDGGWGWFKDESGAHTTAVVMNGLQRGVDAEITIDQGVYERGLQWLMRFQRAEIRRMELPEDNRQFKSVPDHQDALVASILAADGRCESKMLDLLYEHRNVLNVYSKALLGMALHNSDRQDERNMLLQNIEQFLVEDDENQTAHLQLNNGNYWWYWYGSEIETQAAYLKLLVAVDPRSPRAAGLVKYLLNNRSNGYYWSSTRDTAYCIEAISEYFQNSGESQPDLEVQLLVDGELRKEITITPEDIFDYDNQLNLGPEELTSGDHTLEFKKQGDGPLYFNAYLTNFTKEDPIGAAGLEVKVQRRFWKLTPKDEQALVSGQGGQAFLQDVEAYNRQRLWGRNWTLKSGELVEVELIIESKNDYEYLIIEDFKAAGMEPVDVRSGYFGQLGAYRELRDEKVVFFVRRMPEGTHTLNYRLKAEIPGKFSALPTRVEAMYAPELRANADEGKVQIEDR